MSKKINNIEYTDEPIQIGERVPDFLPKPENLILKSPKHPVTITLDQISIDFFKQKAEHQNVSYQRMIGNILQEYVQKMKQK